MNCDDFIQQLMQDPHCKDADFMRHKSSCADCARAWDEEMAFESRLRQAASIDLPPLHCDPQAVVSWWQRPRVWIAGGVLLLALTLTGLHLSRYLFAEERLPQLVLQHIDKEPLLLRRHERLPVDEVAHKLADQGFMLLKIPQNVVAAEPCWMRRGRGMHLVLAGRNGPVTILLMPQESAAAPHAITAPSKNGLLLPTDFGVMAVVGAPGEPVAEMAQEMRKELRWKRHPAWFSF